MQTADASMFLLLIQVEKKNNKITIGIIATSGPTVGNQLYSEMSQL